MNKNKMYSFMEKIFRTTFKNLIFVTALIISCTGCAGQINSKKNSEMKSNESEKIGETFESQIKTDDSNSLVDNSIYTDNTVYNQYKNGKKDGLWKEFDKNSQLISEGNYMNGKANGLMKWYYEGNLVATG
ncbi:MAG: hypothetical protein WAU01_04715, partial [Saprospiraceae bacterium]